MSEENFVQNEINLSNLLNFIWMGKIIISIIILIGFILNIIYFHNTDAKYTAELRVTPAERSGALKEGGLNQLLGNTGLAGDSVSFDLYIEGLHSYLAAERLANDNELLIRLFSNHWDDEKKKWRDPGRNPIVKNIKKIVGYPNVPWKKPDANSVHGYIKQNVKIDNNLQSPMTIISFETSNVELSRDLLTSLHQSVELVLKGRYLKKNREKVEYLTKKMEEATKLDYQKALVASIIEEEQKFITFVGDAAYAAESFGGVEVSSTPTSPKIPLIVISTGLLSFFIGMFVVYVLTILKIRQKNK